MNAAPELNDNLLARIDVPDLPAALAADTDGTFVADVNCYLDGWEVRIKESQDAGVPREEFESLNRLAHGIQTARRVVEIFVKLQQLPPLK